MVIYKPLILICFFSLLELNFLVYIALYAVDVIQYAAVVIRAGNGLSQL